jgi:hypothetical protein
MPTGLFVSMFRMAGSSEDTTPSSHLLGLPSVASTEEDPQDYTGYTLLHFTKTAMKQQLACFASVE